MSRKPNEPIPDVRLLRQRGADGLWRELACHECGSHTGWLRTPAAYVCYACRRGKVRGDGSGGWVKVAP